MNFDKIERQYAVKAFFHENPSVEFGSFWINFVEHNASCFSGFGGWRKARPRVIKALNVKCKKKTSKVSRPLNEFLLYYYTLLNDVIYGCLGRPDNRLYGSA